MTFVPPTRVLTINCGSSSLKFALFESSQSPEQILEGGIDRIGMPDATFRVHRAHSADRHSEVVAAPDQAAAVGLMMDWITHHEGNRPLAAVGHRIVHGGPTYCQPQRITRQMIEGLRRISPFDPEHLPAELRLIEAIAQQFPELPQVACFDTAFHRNLPRVASLLPIPRRYASQGLRRYGFHGLSYEFLMRELERVAGTPAAQGRVVLAHLGNGASLAAIREGRPIDTTMGFTPTAGVPMSTRSGDLDPGLVGYFALTENMTATEFHKMTHSQSGLLGISETSSDMQDLLAIESQDERAAEAVALFCYEIKKRVGAFAAVLGGLDTLVFSGGIGENAAQVRERICDGLQFLGIELQSERNADNAALISPDAGRVAVRVMRTQEALSIVDSVCHVLGLGQPQTQRSPSAASPSHSSSHSPSRSRR
jgi:acetate kinase